MRDNYIEWGEGPWNQEPDGDQWIDTDTGLRCAVIRAPGGYWAGLVGVAPGNSLHGAPFGTLPVAVHGDVNYSGHLDNPGLDQEQWWFGFDCGHFGEGDYAPGIAHALRDLPSGRYFAAPELEYRSIDYAKQQCALLAFQLARLSAPAGAAPGSSATICPAGAQT